MFSKREILFSTEHTEGTFFFPHNLDSGAPTVLTRAPDGARSTGTNNPPCVLWKNLYNICGKINPSVLWKK